MATERMRKIVQANPNLYNPDLTETNPRLGPVKGYPVGTIFDDRKQCSSSGVHAPTVAGISGTIRDGAFSICLSGGYKDDDDHGEFFIYTGTGGQPDSYAGKGEQVEDQTFNHKDNAALFRSWETGGPVRVIRGSQLNSKYAPTQGYRYDGLYTVKNAYTGKSKNGFAICQYKLQRVPDQPPLPINPAYI